MILNAQITGADIYIEDHGVLTFSLDIVTSAGWCTSIGGFYLDWVENNQRVPCKETSTVVRSILETVGVRHWKDLVGKYIRIDDNDKRNSTITKIANIIVDKWIDLRTLFQSDPNEGKQG